MLFLPDLVVPKREFFGLSVDRTCLRGVQINRVGKITGISEVTYPDGVFARNVLVKGDIFRGAVEQLIQKGKFTTPYVSVCFPEAFAYTRELMLPHVPVSDVQEAVTWHVKELFPFPEEELYFDWKVMREDEKGYALTVVAAPKRTIDPIVNVLVSAGLKPLHLKPDASTIAEILNLSQEKHAAVTEVNRTGAYVTLVEGEKAMFTTVIPYSHEDTTASYLSNVKQTIEEITKYYREKNVIQPNEKIDIVLTGEVANDAWVRELPHPAKILTTPIRNPAFNKAYATAIGQRLKTTEVETINLLPPHLKQVYDKERHTLYYQTILFRSASIVGAYVAFVLLILIFVMLEKQRLDTEVKKLITINQAQSASSHNLLAVNGIAKQIVALAPLRKTPKEKFTLFFTLVPSGISITQWEYDDSKQSFTVSGVALTRTDLLTFKSKLEESQVFANISLPLTLLESPKNITFTISFVAK